MMIMIVIMIIVEIRGLADASFVGAAPVAASSDWAYVCISLSLSIYLRIYIYICIHIHVLIYACVCTYIYIYIHTYTHILYSILYYSSDGAYVGRGPPRRQRLCMRNSLGWLRLGWLKICLQYVNIA